MNLGYAYERFYAAVRSLVSEGALKDRLQGAAVNLIGLKPAEFSEGELRKKFSDLMQNLQGFQSENVPNISADDGKKLAEEILSIFDDIAIRDPNYHHHIASDIDLKSHFAQIQTTPRERPDTVYDLRKLTPDELRQLRVLLAKAAISNKPPKKGRRKPKKKRRKK
jgi:hypothetical protein